MGTVVTITLYANTAEQAQQGFVAAFQRIEQLNQILSDYKPDSELSRACTSSATVSPELMTVLLHAQRTAAATGGAFDITVGPMIRLWRTARREKKLPDDASLNEARQRSGYQKLEISEQNRTVHCLAPGMQLDAGGIAKGYAADEGLRILRERGITRAIVAMSGDLAIGDPPPGRAGWTVRVQNQELSLKNTAVSTSGDEFQFVEIGGVRYSHIIDPRTGLALRNSHSVSVIANTGMEADALATALSVLGPEHAGQIPGTGKVRVIFR